jgi:hypothetical protein
MEMGKNTIFLSLIIFLKVFLSQVGKKLDQGGNIILFLIKLITKKLSRKEGKVNYHTAWPVGKHRQRGKTLTQRERIFSPVHRL